MYTTRPGSQRSWLLIRATTTTLTAPKTLSVSRRVSVINDPLFVEKLSQSFYLGHGLNYLLEQFGDTNPRIVSKPISIADDPWGIYQNENYTRGKVSKYFKHPFLWRKSQENQQKSFRTKCLKGSDCHHWLKKIKRGLFYSINLFYTRWDENDYYQDWDQRIKSSTQTNSRNFSFSAVTTFSAQKYRMRTKWN